LPVPSGSIPYSAGRTAANKRIVATTIAAPVAAASRVFDGATGIASWRLDDGNISVR